MVKNIDLDEWVIRELQEIADSEKRPLKSHMELILEKVAKKNMANKRRDGSYSTSKVKTKKQ